MRDDEMHGVDLGRMAADDRTVRRGFRAKIKRAAGRIPFAPEAVAAYFCATDPATPTRVRAALLAALAYFIVPTDLIPDIILGLGYTDDITVFWAAWRLVSAYVTDDHRARARRAIAAQDIPSRD